MTIEEKILQIDARRIAIKISINSSYKVEGLLNLYKLYYDIKVQRVNLLIKKERRDKLKKINLN